MAQILVWFYYQQYLIKMKYLMILSLVTISLSGCVIEMELGEPYIQIRNIDEYETREVIQEIWSRGVLIYEESVYQAWLDIQFQNTGDITASEVSAEIIFYNHHRAIQTARIYLPDIRPGDLYTYSLNSGFESMHDYTDYEVNVYWE